VYWQTLAEQTGAAAPAVTADPHEMPHPPQLDASAVVACSQPSETTPLQSAKPATQVNVHVFAAEQVPPVVCGSVVQLMAPAHVVPQAEFDSCVSQPFAVLPSQSSHPVAHAV
jgi:hypothetical protein